MFFVQVRLNSLDLLAHMSQMPIWLDANRIEATGFSYGQEVFLWPEKKINRAVARIAFKAETEAGEFAARFTGQVIST